VEKSIELTYLHFCLKIPINPLNNKENIENYRHQKQNCSYRSTRAVKRLST
jgi:hypothetical protein